MRAKKRSQIGEEQFGFVAEEETTSILFTFRVLTEKALEVLKHFLVCFVDYDKVFDNV